MAHLWMQDESNQWVFYPLEGETYSLSTLPPSAAPGPRRGDATPAALLLRIAAGPASGGWLLLSGRKGRIWVNGLPLTLGARILRDRDRIHVEGAGTAFLSTESLPGIEPFPGADPPALCPRCRLAIKTETPAVRCPGCRVWFHQSEEYPCWSYGDACVLCPQETDLEAGFRWVPEGM